MAATDAETQLASCTLWAPNAGAGQPSIVVTQRTPSVPTAGLCRVDYTYVPSTGGAAQAGAVTQPITTLTGQTCSGSCSSKAGTISSQNFTLGWARGPKPDVSDAVIAYPYPPTGTSCDGTCAFTIGQLTDGWRSQQPGPTGLYRLSGNFESTYTGATCSTITPNANPAASPPACPGVLGYINGKPVCAAVSPSTPLPSASAPATPLPQGYGNPPAGTKPTTGPGSGSGSNATPLVGDGGNAGGGSSAAVPVGDSTSGGGPVTNDTKTKDPCGIPGQPACKIDETGTPTGSGITGAANTVKANGDALIAAVGAVDKPSSLGWGFGLVLPTSSCQNFQMWKPSGTWDIDVCSSWLVALLRDFIAWAFAVLTAVYIYRSVTGTLSSQG